MPSNPPHDPNDPSPFPPKNPPPQPCAPKPKRADELPGIPHEQVLEYQKNEGKPHAR